MVSPLHVTHKSWLSAQCSQQISYKDLDNAVEQYTILALWIHTANDYEAKQIYVGATGESPHMA